MKKTRYFKRLSAHHRGWFTPGKVYEFRVWRGALYVTHDKGDEICLRVYDTQASPAWEEMTSG